MAQYDFRGMLHMTRQLQMDMKSLELKVADISRINETNAAVLKDNISQKVSDELYTIQEQIRQINKIIEDNRKVVENSTKDLESVEGSFRV